MGLQNLSLEEIRNVWNTISRFCSKLFQKWEDCQKKNDRFVCENAIWLEQKEVLPVHVLVHEEESSGHPVECVHLHKDKDPGRLSISQAEERKGGKRKLYEKVSRRWI